MEAYFYLISYVIFSIPGLWYLYRWYVVRKNKLVYFDKKMDRQLKRATTFLILLGIFTLCYSVAFNHIFFLIPILFDLALMVIADQEKRKNFDKCIRFEPDGEYIFTATSVCNGYFIGDVKVGLKEVPGLLESPDHTSDEYILKKDFEPRRFLINFMDDRISLRFSNQLELVREA